MKPLRIWTIGHSTRTIEEFLNLLRLQSIQMLADVRQFPGSRRLPHFGQQALRESLQQTGIKYIHLPELGGRRRARPDSPNIAWRNEAFRGYADYMLTAEFQAGLKRLVDLATIQNVAMMCAEALWWQCHRGLIADRLKVEGHEVIHILGSQKTEEHPFTSAARIVDGKLSYGLESDPQLPF